MKTSKSTKEINISETGQGISSLSSLLLYIAALLLFFTYLFIRIRTFEIPLSRDEGSYAYLGRLAMQGKIPFKDFYEMKPPLLYYAYGLGNLLFGYSTTGLHVFSMILNLATAFFIYYLSKNFVSKPLSVLASAIYLIFCISEGGFGFAMVSEHIVNLLSIIAIFFLFNENTRYHLIYSGVFFGLAISVKQSALLLFFAAFVYLFLQSSEHKWTSIKRHQNLVKLVIGIKVILLLNIIFLFLSGSWLEAYYWLWEHPHSYLTSLSHEKAILAFRFSIKKLFAENAILLSLSIIAIFLNVYYYIRKKTDKRVIFFILYFAMAALSTIAGFRFYGQYWQLIYPALAISFILLIHERMMHNPTKQIFIAGLLFLLVSTNIIIDKNYYFIKKIDTIVLQAFPGNPFPQIKQIGKFLEKKMKSQDQLFVLGSEPELYVYTQKNSISKHYYHALLSANNDKNSAREEECIQNMKNTMPEFMVMNYYGLSWMFKENSKQNLYKQAFYFLQNRYQIILVYDIKKNKFFYDNDAANYDIATGDCIVAYQIKKNE